MIKVWKMIWATCMTALTALDDTDAIVSIAVSTGRRGKGTADILEIDRGARIASPMKGL